VSELRTLADAARRRAAGDLDGAIAALDELQPDRPDDPYLLAARAQARLDRALMVGGASEETDSREAVLMLEAATERAGDDAWLHSQLAFARFWGRSDAAGAEAAYRRALEVDSSQPDALAGAAELQGNPSADVSAEEARAWRERLAELQPEDAANWLALARLCEAAGDESAAARAAARALLSRGAKDPDAVVSEFG
jgi:tetratricopeptide (TPR) repeat protein